MVVFHYIPSLDCTTGGTAAYMQLLSKEIGKIIELHIVTHNSENPVSLVNVQIHYINASVFGKMKQDFRLLLQEFKPNVVHINGCWLPQCAFIQKWAQQEGYKIVLSPHGMLDPFVIKRHYWTRKLPALCLYQRKAIVKADCLLATSEREMLSLLQLKYNNNIAVIPTGIDIEAIETKSTWNKTKIILSLSRIHKHKGLNFLIEAVANMKDTLSGYRVLIAGDGDPFYIEQLKNLSLKLGVDKIVNFIGGVYGENKWRLYKKADFFILPTFSENFGIVIAEALASGTPVITTKGTPWQDLETNHCGWWVDIGTEGLIPALEAAVSLNEMDLEIMGTNGRKLIEKKYSSRVMAEDMVKLYEKINNDK